MNLPDSCVRVFNHCSRSPPTASSRIAWCARFPFPSFEPALSSPRNKVRITREHAPPRRSPPTHSFFFFYYATFTRENNARAHFTRVICSPGCPRPPPTPLFVARCSGGKEEKRGWTVAPKACQSTCPTLTSLSELKRTLPTRRSHFAPPIDPRNPLLSPLSSLALRRYLRPSAIYLVKLAWNAHMLANGCTHTCTNER